MFLHLVCGRKDGFVYHWFLREKKLSVEELNALTRFSPGTVNCGSFYSIIDFSGDMHKTEYGTALDAIKKAAAACEANTPESKKLYREIAFYIWIGLRFAKCEKIPRD
jgi:hypothetical protein